jgi:hypothetical protein
VSTIATRRVVKQCARCGRYLSEGRWVYSSYTGNRFCIDDRACRRRTKRRNGQ